MSETPTRAQLIERYGEPDDFAECGPVTNDDRAEWGLDAIRAFADGKYFPDGIDSEALYVIAGDLISDILHAVTCAGDDPQAAYASGWNHFEHEVGLGYGDADDYAEVDA